MATFLVAVLSNPAEGREDEFNEWYEHTHLDEVLSSAGFRSAQRFQLAAQAGFAASHRYLALYETDGESAQEVIDRLNATRGQRQQSRSIDNRAAALWVFSPTGERHEVR
ncbi:MAG: hypothetical protein AB7W59_01000 [Acidimicrobiia bacterium]